jgi:O-antigen ligase
MQLRLENEFSGFIKWAILFFIAIIFASLAFSIRIFNSISIISLVVLIFISRKRETLFLNSFTNWIFLSLFIYFLIQACGLLYTHNQQVQLKEVSQKAGVIAIPFFFMSGIVLSQNRLKHLITFFSICLISVSVYCLINAYFLYAQTRNANVFFYHTLLKPFDLHAVFFSWYLFFVILFLLENNVFSGKFNLIKLLVSLNIIFFIFLIILLSSKLVIITLIVYGVYYVTKTIIKRRIKFYWVAIFSVLFISTLYFTGQSNNPVSRRFKDLESGNDTLFLQNKFSPDIYFNGLQFRLLTWRLVGKILSENKAWVLGVSAGDAQQKLNEEYRLSHIYLGNGQSSTGFLNFNCHNVYLQTLLESGIIGLIVLLGFIVFFFIEIIKAKNRIALVFFISMLVFGFSESLLSSQYPIQLFLFLPLLLLVSKYKA